MSLVHELEQLVYNSFEKLPVRFEEPRILPNNIHNIRGNDSLIVLATFHFGETQQVLDHSHKETLLCFLTCPMYCLAE